MPIIQSQFALKIFALHSQRLRKDPILQRPHRTNVGPKLDPDRHRKLENNMGHWRNFDYRTDCDVTKQGKDFLQELDIASHVQRPFYSPPRLCSKMGAPKRKLGLRAISKARMRAGWINAGKWGQHSKRVERGKATTEGREREARGGKRIYGGRNGLEKCWLSQISLSFPLPPTIFGVPLSSF